MRHLKMVVCALAVVAMSPAGFAQNGSGPCATATGTAVLAGENEPGERLVVRGTVFQPDGSTPAPGVILYIYQTDARGHYNEQRGQPPRIRGWMKTDAQGRYRFTTIVPGAYPSGRQAAHIHPQLWGGGHPWQWNHELLFEGDPNLSARDRQLSQDLGRFGFIKQPQRDGSGVLAVTHDIRLKARGDQPEGNIMHGLQACGLAR